MTRKLSLFDFLSLLIICEKDTSQRSAGMGYAFAFCVNDNH